MRYCFDTSGFIQPWRYIYPPDLFSPLWQKIEELIKRGEIGSSEIVLDDLKRIEDEVFRWAKTQNNLFAKLDGPIQREVREILNVYPRLVEQGGRRSASDPFVVALAKINNACVITYELFHPNSARVNIPFVCRHYNIRCKDLLGMMRDYSWRFNFVD